MTKRNVIVFAVTMGIICLLPTAGCSGAKGDSILPKPEDESIIQSPEKEAQSERMLWGMWEFSYDESSNELAPRPLREAFAHFNITPMLLPPNCNDCLKIKVNSFDTVTRILDADVTLRNPTQLTGYDVRGILYTNDYGHSLTNADDWTGLWDIAGGQTINPFKAFAKSVGNRAFAPGFVDTENYLIYIPIPPHWEKITFAADASWPGNCKEPYEITNFWQETIYNTMGSSGNIYIDVHDWQGDVGQVTVFAPEITGQPFSVLNNLSGDTWNVELVNTTGAPIGEHIVQLSATSGKEGNNVLHDFCVITISEFSGPVVTGIDPYELNIGTDRTGVIVSGSNFKGPKPEVTLKKTGADDIKALNVTFLDESTIMCDLSIPLASLPGSYDVEVANGDGQSGKGPELLKILNVGPLTLVDVTSPYLQYSYPDCVCIDGNYLYFGDGMDPWVYVLDISDPLYPVWLTRVELPSFPSDIFITGHYAYIAGGELTIIDITDPQNPLIVNALVAPGLRVSVSNGYAYLPDCVVDVDPPQEAHIVKNVGVFYYGYDNAIQGDYEYVADGPKGVKVIDISQPELAEVVHTIETPGSAYGVCADGGYLYVADWDNGLHIVDISTPESAYILKTVDTPGGANSVDVAGGYAYIADWNEGLQVIDVDPIDSATIVKNISGDGSAENIEINNELAIFTDYYQAGIRIIDISSPEDAHQYTSIGNPSYAVCIAATNDYAIRGPLGHWPQIVDTTLPQNAYILRTMDLYGDFWYVTISGQFAYLSTYGYIYVVDIRPPNDGSLIKSITEAEWPGWKGVAISAGYAFAGSVQGLKIIDIFPPEEATVIKTLPLDNAEDVAIYNDIACITGYGSNNLYIVDIDPISTASVVKTLHLGKDPWRVAVSGGYAFVWYWEDDEVSVIDIDPPESAYCINSLDAGGYVREIDISGGYAFITGGWQNGFLEVFDIDPISEAHSVKLLYDLPGCFKPVDGIAVMGKYAYLVSTDMTWVYELWE